MNQMRTFAPNGKGETSIPGDAPRDSPNDEDEEDPLLPGKEKGLCFLFLNGSTLKLYPKSLQEWTLESSCGKSCKSGEGTHMQAERLLFLNGLNNIWKWAAVSL